MKKEKEDKGHKLLIEDLQEIWENANEYEFHDFKNNMYGSPKMVLRARLLNMAQAVIDGKYDN